MAVDDKVVIGQAHGVDDPESVPDAAAGDGFCPFQLAGSGRLERTVRVCVKTRHLEDADWVQGAEVKGAPALYEFTQGGALTFDY